MTIIRVPKSWEIPEQEATPESVYFNRRRFLKTLLGASVGATIMPIVGCKQGEQVNSKLADSLDTASLAAEPNSTFSAVDRPTTDAILAGQYNNYYEFGSGKSIWQAAQALPTEDWKVEVTGLVKNPRTYDLDDLQKTFPIEERLYRFRCVEAWSMVIPWIGFPMKSLIAAVEPTDQAKFVSFTSYYDKEITVGPLWSLGKKLPWPYTEGLRLEEMANDLAFFAIGNYGHMLPKQHGAPIRAVLPWKYGFKGAKAIAKIEFLDTQPPTFWNTIDSHEYDFEANVNPNKPHPRWSQATEKFISKGPGLKWEKRPTLPYNGYGNYVANLYV
ncbi:protein-methionine-sulfoxide reductase catalytic subunit MsrP [Microcoleus sp. FACHB-SPT15]|uniref:protein-methionine-sulfoxide reductase catalytic subunit MsrP n=1 Tax=Microcoleus sp. FACHB-SPT15 TaxID=2692830 RepID=UPI00177C9E5B|nr:protein-methionine-sulfoxide reductase catalytic subunit MsrP [Microcoleus sp. FACHB-SPT15]MBD1806764.1 protein-methionine-sulfoxide reductase catalytic subunit MsrP [Microcoleus sp. FACHB-SPT15]